MKKLCLLIVSIVMLMAAPAMAVSYSWIGTYDPANWKMKSDDSSTWIHEKLVSLTGFNPATDTVTSAYAKIWAYDDADLSYEYARADFTTSNVDVTTWEVDYTPKVIPLVQALWGLDDGSTYFSLKATSGDFYFDKIEFHASGTRAVPEPAALLLLGSGILGVVALRRRVK